jgi:flagellar protein FlgJ
MSTPPATPAITDFHQFGALRAAADRNDPKALRAAAQQFEALLTETMLKSAHATQFGDDLTGEQGGFYQDLYDQQLAMHLASSGHGLGIADMLVRQLGGAATAGNGAKPTQISAASAYGSTRAVTPSAVSAADKSAMADAPKSIDEFVTAVQPHAEKAAADLGVPVRALIAQAALETGWGKHVSKQPDGSGYNLFGIKAGASWQGASATAVTREFADGGWSKESARFRSYGSMAAGFDDYVQFLKNNPRYADALRAGDVHGFAQGLQKAGYATDPQYAEKLVRVAYSPELNGALAAAGIVSA